MLAGTNFAREPGALTGVEGASCSFPLRRLLRSSESVGSTRHACFRQFEAERRHHWVLDVWLGIARPPETNVRVETLLADVMVILSDWANL